MNVDPAVVKFPEFSIYNDDNGYCIHGYTPPPPGIIFSHIVFKTMLV